MVSEKSINFEVMPQITSAPNETLFVELILSNSTAHFKFKS